MLTMSVSPEPYSAASDVSTLSGTEIVPDDTPVDELGKMTAFMIPLTGRSPTVCLLMVTEIYSLVTAPVHVIPSEL